MKNHKSLQVLRTWLIALPREGKQSSMVVADGLSYVVSAVVAYGIVYGSMEFSSTVLAISIGAVLIAVPVHWAFGLYASIVRYMGLSLIAVGLKTTFIVTASLMSLFAFAGIISAPIRLGIVFWSFSLILTVGGRLTARMFLKRQNTNRETVIVYGAGSSGAQLVSALRNGDDYLPVALIDDNNELHGKRVQGLRVYSPKRIEHLLENMEATRVLLAIPSASRRSRRRVLERLSEFPVHVQTMPEIGDIISGKARVENIQEVSVEDLLGRNSVPPSPKLLGGSITGKNVMVTGAGGSIGSELCRQIVHQNPNTLVCFDISEAALYSIDRELGKLIEDLGSSCELIALLGSVHHEQRIREALEVFGIQTVYHAAAYKHVPIVEHNLFEGVHNNIFGTLHAARAAVAAGVEKFVLISTDKAVNPTSVMGATKRCAELVLQAIDSQSSNMRSCMVRFGNVLESSGSVVPLFREQIRNGGPVTITHRDIIRYFMTIPEAAQLVIQASSMTTGGDVFVLDMGEPVKIEALAHRMINLMGRSVRDESNPDGDIEIQYIGLRPAEKLYEELLIGANVKGTEHPRIMRADEDCLPFEQLTDLLNRLKLASDRLDYIGAREILLNAVKEYAPSNEVDDLIWRRKSGSESRRKNETVVNFPTRNL